ncbi:hypothetical protein C8R46DRAFT_1237636 [Mycena filopes]|nr:hypothetical protein C8R46DRAFT_1237636 [Mycena filopes]
MHVPDILKNWGPLASQNEFMGERVNNMLQKVKTNEHFWDMDYTRVRHFARLGRLLAKKHDKHEHGELQGLDNILDPIDPKDRRAPTQLDEEGLATFLAKKSSNIPRSLYTLILEYLDLIGENKLSFYGTRNAAGTITLPDPDYRSMILPPRGKRVINYVHPWLDWVLFAIRAMNIAGRVLLLSMLLTNSAIALVSFALQRISPTSSLPVQTPVPTAPPRLVHLHLHWQDPADRGHCSHRPRPLYVNTALVGTAPNTTNVRLLSTPASAICDPAPRPLYVNAALVGAAPNTTDVRPLSTPASASSAISAPAPRLLYVNTALVGAAPNTFGTDLLHGLGAECTECAGGKNTGQHHQQPIVHAPLPLPSHQSQTTTQTQLDSLDALDDSDVHWGRPGSADGRPSVTLIKSEAPR